MAYVTKIAKQASAKMRQMLSNDPLLHPLGRAPDSTIDEALATRGLERADLFRWGKTTLAPHRHRIAAMLGAYNLLPTQITAHQWLELKRADHYCAYCTNKRRCENWLRGRSPLLDDAPRMFCPNAMTFERWQLATAHPEAPENADH